MTKFLSSLVMLLMLTTVNSFAGDASNGQQLYGKCVLCHGANGEGKESQKAPQISGQFDWYIVKALNDFKSGARKNPTMMPYIKGLSQSDFEDLAAYISQIKVK
ncbi:MAG: cytochrome c [Bacteriovoracaceae bacterium]|nr:cytochrome c [Bacteriovoracaceae bacterium]